MGFSLYNMGFTAGLVGTLLVALCMSFGFMANLVFVWTTGNNMLLRGFLPVVFGSMVVGRFLLDRAALAQLGLVFRASRQSSTDFIAKAGMAATLFNMGLCGAVLTPHIYNV